MGCKPELTTLTKGAFDLKVSTHERHEFFGDGEPKPSSSAINRN
jgi:hypothetical protein